MPLVTETFEPFGWLQFCGNSLSKALCWSSMTVPCAQCEVHKDMVRRVWCGGTQLTDHDPWPKSHWTPLGGIRMLTGSQAFLSNFHAWPHEYFFGCMGTNSHKHSPTMLWKAFPEKQQLSKLQREVQVHINGHGFTGMGGQNLAQFGSQMVPIEKWPCGQLLHRCERQSRR